MIASTQARPQFLERVSNVHVRSRRVRWAVLAAGTLVGWLVLVGLIAVLDFLWEWSWPVRAGALALATAAVAAGAIRGCWLEWRRRSPNRTAAEMETTFPALGQRARTTIQFGGRSAEEMRRDGVRPELVDALLRETSQQSETLPLGEVVPRRRLQAVCGLLVLAGAVLALACVDWEWRRAISRTLLADVPYTELTVTPGDVTVQTGAAVGISVELSGRTDRRVVIRTRELEPGKTSRAWTSQEALANPTADDEPRVASFGVGLEGIQRSLLYRIEADDLVSPEYRIDVLDPLTVSRVSATVQYPEYTRLPARTVADGAVSALRGSVCHFAVELSRAPEQVSLSLQELPTKSHPVEPFEDVVVEGSLVSFTVTADRNLLWTLSATTADGVSLGERPYRIRVTEDRPPKLAFDDPDDGIEVHTLAELPMRARASDDYGLSRSGIVFQISGSEEFTLLEEHFDDVLEAVEAAATAEVVPPRTRSVLERLLPLEHFELTQKDSVMYYAFAEDNRPHDPQRTESDRRFIDIRPLTQTFRRQDDDGDGGGGGGGGRLRSLRELIRRERSILNWTIKMSQRVDGDDPRDVYSFDRLMRSQAEVADLTRLLAERLEQRGVDDVDAFYQAEAVMLEAIDSLSVGDLETAQLQEKDAQQYLVEGRNRLEVLLSNRASDRVNYQAFRSIDNMILQRLRRDPNDERDRRNAARLLVTQLIRLARREETIAEQLTAAATPSSSIEGPAAGSDEDPSPNEPDSESSGGGEPEEQPPADQNGEASEETDEGNSDEQATPADLVDVEESQFELLADAREVAEEMTDMEGVTALANERMTRITEDLEETAEAIEGRDVPTAESGARQSARQLRELARQIIGLTQGDVMERLAFGQNLTTDLSRRQRQTADDLEAESEQEPDEAPAGALPIDATASDLVERALTLEDVLTTIAASTNQEEAEAADRVTEAIEERNLAGVRERLEELAEQLEQEEPVGGAAADSDESEETPGSVAAAAELRDAADSMERLAADLSQIRRQLLTPVIERLRELEEQTAELADRLDEPGNERQGGELTDELKTLMEEMEMAGVGGDVREELSEMLQGRGRSEIWDRQGGSDALKLNSEYRQALSELLEELQLEIQELVLADTDLDVESPVPAKYAPLVNRYLKVLSRRE